ncbi:hypothetical protein [Flavobacterium palustre]|uniref:hypothetical protein n=1 Tax=Flavobacterium palustre TaxID=1476463 RepID=UPI00361367A3
MFQSKKDTVYLILAGIFITNAVVAELIGGKLIQIGPFIMSLGILPGLSFSLPPILSTNILAKKESKTLFYYRGTYCLLYSYSFHWNKNPCSYH